MLGVLILYRDSGVLTGPYPAGAFASPEDVARSVRHRQPTDCATSVDGPGTSETIIRCSFDERGGRKSSPPRGGTRQPGTGASAQVNPPGPTGAELPRA